MRQQLTVITRKGQVTVPAEIRKALNLEVGDKLAVSMEDGDAPRVTLRPVRSVTDLTFGAIVARSRSVDVDALRDLAMEEIAENADREGRPNPRE